MQNYNSKNTIHFIVNILKKNIFIFLCLLISILIIAVLETSIIGSIDPIIKILQNKNSLDAIYNDVFKKYNLITLEEFKRYFFLFICLILLLSGAVNILSFYLANKLTIGLNFEWKNRIINNYFYKEINFFDKNFTGDLIQKINLHTQNASSIVYYLALILKEFIIVTAIYILLLTISIKFTVALTLFFFIILVLTNLFGKYYILKKTLDRNFAQTNVFNYTSIIIDGIKTIKLFNKQNYFRNKFFYYSNIQKKIDINTNTLVNIPSILLRTLTFIGLIVLIFLSAYNWILINNISFLVIYIASAYKINNSVGAITNGMLNISSIFPSLDIVRREILQPKTKKEKNFLNTDFKNLIKIKNIQFSYNNNSEKIFNKLNFLIKKNKFYIIYGASGSGKSTFADLLVGFLKSKAKIKIDNYNYFDLNKFGNKAIAYSNQNTNLFPGSVVQNITLFESKVDRKKLNKIVRICKINNLLKKNINGKFIMEGGKNLSGGQHQRIALARTLYLNRNIILLDECISNVEKKLERQIMINIKRYANKVNKTIIVITHSNHYFDLADEVYELNNKRLKIRKKS
jgi:ATP-binding cassette subfamily C protein